MLKLVAFPLALLLLTTSSTSHLTVACTLNKLKHHSKYNKHPVFTLHDITYSSSLTYSTPAHLAVSEGRIGFNLTNSALSYATHCSGFSSHPFGFFFGDILYQCDAVAGKEVGTGASANFTFSKPDGAFNVNQTWSCDCGYTDEHHKTEKFLGTGSGKAVLDCQTNAWTNSNWTIGEIYSITTTNCKPAELQIKPTVLAAP